MPWYAEVEPNIDQGPYLSGQTAIVPAGTPGAVWYDRLPSSNWWTDALGPQLLDYAFDAVVSAIAPIPTSIPGVDLALEGSEGRTLFDVGDPNEPVTYPREAFTRRQPVSNGFPTTFDFDFGDIDFGEVLQTGVQLYQAFDGNGGGTQPVVYQGAPAPAMPGGEVMPTAGIGGAVAAGGIWLSSYLARAFGRAGAAAIFTAANGVRVRLNQLWPLVRQYGPQAVAGGLGITLGSLGTLLAQAPTTGRKRRRRGISARDVSTTRRTIRQLRKLTRLAGIRTGGGGYRGRGRHWHKGYYA